MTSITGVDRSRALELLENMSRSMNDVASRLNAASVQIENGDLPTQKGHEVLELKNHLMLSYLVNLTHLMHGKVSGKSLEGSSDVDRLVEIRTVLEKMRSVEKKLKNEFDRKVKAVQTGIVDTNDPMCFKPDVKSIFSQLDSEDSEGSAEKDDVDDKDVYKPYKSNPSYFDESLSKKHERKDEKTKKRLLSSGMLQDLAYELTDAPEERAEQFHRESNAKVNRKEQERIEYEETYLTRIQPPKKKKNEQSSRKRKSSKSGKGTKRRKMHN